MPFTRYLFIVFFVISSLLPFYTFAFLPVIAAPLIEVILGRIIASRVALYVASGAAGSATVYATSKYTNATLEGMTKSLIESDKNFSDAYTIYRNVNEALIWAAPNYLYQNIPFQQYLNSGVGVITEGFEKGGKFFAYVAGKLVELAFLPSKTSPYLYDSSSVPHSPSQIPHSDGYNNAIQQCHSSYLVFDEGTDFFCGSSIEGAAQEFFNATYGPGVSWCDSVSFQSVDPQSKKIWYTCFRQDSYDYSQSATFQWSETNYQPPPPSPDDLPVLLPDKPADLIKPSLSNPVPLSDVAGMLNAIAQDAASRSDYQGVPFSPSNPITEQEVKQAMAGNGTSSSPALSNPTVKDILAPAQSGSSSSPISADVPSSAAVVPSDTPSTSDNTQEKPDYSFPATSAPYLESPPDGDTILKPLTSLLPFLKDFQFHTRQSECPVFSFDFLDTKITINQHCQFLSAYGALIKSVCTAFWLFSSLRIILSA